MIPQPQTGSVCMYVDGTLFGSARVTPCDVFVSPLRLWEKIWSAAGAAFCQILGDCIRSAETRTPPLNHIQNCTAQERRTKGRQKHFFAPRLSLLGSKHRRNATFKRNPLARTSLTANSFTTMHSFQSLQTTATLATYTHNRYGFLCKRESYVSTSLFIVVVVIVFLSCSRVWMWRHGRSVAQYISRLIALLQWLQDHKRGLLWFNMSDPIP